MAQPRCMVQMEVLQGGRPSEKFLIAALVSVAFVPVANAATVENDLFVCTGELIKDQSGYSIIERGVREKEYPMDCYIDGGKMLRRC